MPAVDFGSWATPNLVLTLGDHTYEVRPPSVEASKQLLAAAVSGEVKLGLVAGPIPDEVLAVLETIAPGEHPALGDAYDWMIADGIDDATLNRMAYYAVFYWARGKDYADVLAKLLWQPMPEEGAQGVVEPGPKAPASSPPRSGQNSGSGNRSTKTKTASRSTPTTASRKR